MFMNPWKAAFATFAMAASMQVGAGRIARAEDDEPKKPENSAAKAGSSEDWTGVSTAREGYTVSVRLLEKAKNAEDVGRAADKVYLWSRRIAEAETSSGSTRLDAARAHFQRMNALVQSGQKNSISDSDADAVAQAALNILYFRSDAGREMKAAAGDGGSAPSQKYIGRLKADNIQVTGLGDVTVFREPPETAGVIPTPAPVKDARTLAVLKALDERVEMAFHNETPLEDVLKYIQEKTKSKEFPEGVPIYVDPTGLQEAEKTMTSPIAIELKGVPLRRTLQLALKQLGLVYMVDDGLIQVGSEGSDGALPPAIHEQSPLEILQKRAERGELSAAERKAFIEMLKDLREIDQLAHPENDHGKDNTPVEGGLRMGGGIQ